jgi:hypothetical protein
VLFVDSAIKKKCCDDHMAVPTQVIIHKNIIRDNVMSVATKVALQINCKLGGAPWTVDIQVKVCLYCIYLNIRYPAYEVTPLYNLQFSEKHLYRRLVLCAIITSLSIF